MENGALFPKKPGDLQVLSRQLILGPYYTLLLYMFLYIYRYICIHLSFQFEDPRSPNALQGAHKNPDRPKSGLQVPTKHAPASHERCSVGLGPRV